MTTLLVGLGLGTFGLPLLQTKVNDCYNLRILDALSDSSKG